MSIDAYITIAILAVMFALLIKSKLPPVVIFMGALTLTITFRLAPLKESLKGFSNSGVLTIGALFMVAAGMYATGAISMITDKLIGRPKTLVRAQAKILPMVAFGSAFLNNTPLVAMFIPVIRDLSRTCRLAATRLYIPLSYSSILGGICTLIGTSTNLVISGMIIDLIAKGGTNMPAVREIKMFDPAWVGVPAAVAGLVYLIVFSKWLLPDPKEIEDTSETRRFYGAAFKVESGSALCGKTLEEAGFIDQPGFELLYLERSNGQRPDISNTLKLESGDVLNFSSQIETIQDLWATDGLSPRIVPHQIESERYTHNLVEVAVSRRSEALDKKISDLPLPDSPYKLNIVAFSRGGKPPDTPMEDFRITAGDIVVLEVDDTFFYENRNEVEFSLTKRLTRARLQRTDKAVTASVITVVMVTVVALGWMSMLNAALIASGLMLLTGCMTLGAAARSVEFKTLIVIAAAIGLESAVTGSGLSATIASGLSIIGGDNPHIALAVVFAGCILMDTLTTNVASAALIFPIALAMATQLGVNFMPFAITLMVGSSCSFISPMGYAANLMVYEPGGYRFIDYVKMGTPLTVIVGIVIVLLAPLVWPF